MFNMSTSIAFVFAAIIAGCLAQSYINEGLSRHNSYRARHKAGPLRLDNNLNQKAAQCARHYANKNTIDHSCPVKGRVGENLAYTMDGRGSPSQSAAMKQAVDDWYNEVQWYNYDDPGRSNPPRGKYYEHFTQLVWKASTKVGLASYQDPASKRTYTVALYEPPGNMRWGGSGGQFKLYKENVLRP